MQCFVDLACCSLLLEVKSADAAGIGSSPERLNSTVEWAKEGLSSRGLLHAVLVVEVVELLLVSKSFQLLRAEFGLGSGVVIWTVGCRGDRLAGSTSLLRENGALHFLNSLIAPTMQSTNKIAIVIKQTKTPSQLSSQKLA